MRDSICNNMRRRKLTNTIYHITQFAISFFLIVYYLYLLQISLQLCRQRSKRWKSFCCVITFHMNLNVKRFLRNTIYTITIQSVENKNYIIIEILYNNRLFLLRNFREVQSTVPTWWEEIENWGNEHSSNVAWNVMTIILL